MTWYLARDPSNHHCVLYQREALLKSYHDKSGWLAAVFPFLSPYPRLTQSSPIVLEVSCVHPASPPELNPRAALSQAGAAGTEGTSGCDGEMEMSILQHPTAWHMDFMTPAFTGSVQPLTQAFSMWVTHT